MSARPTSRVRRLVPAAIASVALALVASACEFDGAYDLPLPGGIVSDEDSYTITADFADVLAVVPRSAVMVDDVPVGEVKEVERVGWHARVTIWVRNDVDLPDNARAEIRQTSLLGEKYVALEPPTDEAPTGRLSEGDQLPLVDTGRNPEVEEVLGALSFLLSGGGVGQLATITHELNAIMSGRTERLRSLLSRLEAVVGTVDDQKTEIIAAMASINNLTATLNREKDTIGDALDSVAPAVGVLSAQHRNLVKMLRALDRLGQVGTRVIAASKDDLLASLAHLEPVLTKLNQAGSNLVPGLSLLLSFPFPQEANDIVHGDFANTRMRLDVSLKNLEIPSGPGVPTPTIPGVPIPTIPLPTIPGLPDLPGLRSSTTQAPAAEDCARARSILGPACQGWLASPEKFRTLMLACRSAALESTPICRSLDDLPLRRVSTPTPDPTYWGLGPALTDGFDTPMGTPDSLYDGSADSGVAP
ncbi:MAG TPA: MCE family protein [Nocardioides sp.]